jgi:hypothetical protein
MRNVSCLEADGIDSTLRQSLDQTVYMSGHAQYFVFSIRLFSLNTTTLSTADSVSALACAMFRI